MDTINVLVLAEIGKENLRRIAEVSPRIKVIDGSPLWDGRPEFAGGRKNISSAEFDSLLADAEVIYSFTVPRDIAARAPKLKWVQIMGAGADSVLRSDIPKSRIIASNVSGIHRAPIAETTICMMLNFAKRTLRDFQSKSMKRWEQHATDLLRDQTVGIIGLGSIGKEIARLGKAFGMKVIATRRSAKEGSRARNVDVLLPKTRLNELLSQSDYVVMVLPSTPETNKMVGERELKAMKPTAYLINVGRGSTVDEEALIHACEKGWIAGAGLDVYAVEPLPADSKLWTLPNVILSPHISGKMKNNKEAAAALFCENLERYVNGKKLFNVVDKKRGY